MCIDVYTGATNANRVDDLAVEDARRRALSRRARARRPGVTVLCRVVAGVGLDAFLDHLARERVSFWRRNLELEAVLIPPDGQTQSLAVAAARYGGGWVTVAEAGIPSGDTFNRVARDFASGDAVLLVDTAIRAVPGETPILECYLHLAGAREVGVVAPALRNTAGATIERGLRLVHDEAHRGCAFVPREGPPPARGGSDAIDATASSFVLVRWDTFSRAGGLDAQLPHGLAMIGLCLAADRLGWRSHRLDAGPLTVLVDADVDGAALPVLASPRFARRWRSFVEVRFP